MPVGASLASIAGSAASGIIGANAASNAGKLAQQAATQGNQIISNQMGQNTSNLQPYAQQGQQYNSALAGLLGVGGNPAASAAAFQNYLGSTNYNFVRNQGLQGVEYANAPSFDSGATAKALDVYNTGLAGNALGGYESMLFGGAQLGQTAGANLGQLNTGASEQQSANLLAAAGQQINANNQGVNAITGALKGVTSGLSSFGNAGGGSSALSGLFGGGQAAQQGSAFGQIGQTQNTDLNNMFSATGF